MRAIIICIGFLFFIFSVGAQTVTLFPSDTLVQLNNVDITDPFKSYYTQIDIKNETTDTLMVVWRKEIPSDCPYVWGFIVGDIYVTYPPNVFSNYDPDLGVNQPFPLLPGQMTMGANVGLLPRSVPGCCNFKIHFSELNNLDSVLASANFDFRVNDENCDLVNNEEVEENGITIFPNPVNDVIFINSEKELDQVQLINLRGQMVKEIIQENNIDIHDLPNGVYVLKVSIGSKLFVRKIEKH